MKDAPDVPLVISRPHYISGRDCGYCHGEKTDFYALESQKATMGNKPSQSITIGLQVEQMSCQHYDEFINQGFRRSGTFLYKQDLLRGCCRLFTIRTDWDQLKVTKQHRKTVNRFIREISDDYKSRDGSKSFDLHSLVEAEQQSSRFYTRYEPSAFSTEKFELYKKYQVRVHSDDPADVTESSFKRFLCDTPFPDPEVAGTQADWDTLNLWVAQWKPNQNRQSHRVGPTHECYYLDGHLVAVSVMDFLPTGVSSIYFIWDPDYAHLSLGTLLGLREIVMCHQLGLGYYYLGYYIDDCPKMRYKQQFGGELLDVCNDVYVPLEEVRPFIANGRFFVVALSQDDDQSNDSNDQSNDSNDQSNDSNDPSNTSNTSSDSDDEPHEPELANTGHPVSLADSPFHLPLRNVADQIYANDAVYAEANTSLAVLRSSYRLRPTSASTYTLPPVVPGLTPLWQILEWFHSGAVDDGLPVSIFSTTTATLNECTLGELSGPGRALVVDCIRLLGLEKVQDAIILV